MFLSIMKKNYRLWWKGKYTFIEPECITVCITHAQKGYCVEPERSQVTLPRDVILVYVPSLTTKDALSWGKFSSVVCMNCIASNLTVNTKSDTIRILK